MFLFFYLSVKFLLLVLLSLNSRSNKNSKDNNLIYMLCRNVYASLALVSYILFKYYNIRIKYIPISSFDFFASHVKFRFQEITVSIDFSSLGNINYYLDTFIILIIIFIFIFKLIHWFALTENIHFYIYISSWFHDLIIIYLYFFYELY